MLQDSHLYVEGVATKEDLVVPFYGGLILPAEGDQRVVQGIALDAPLTDGTVVVVHVQPDAWFQDANFEVLLEQTPDAHGRYPIIAGSQVERAWFIGARSIALPGGFSAFSVSAVQGSE
jgi:hypothetical protein